MSYCLFAYSKINKKPKIEATSALFFIHLLQIQSYPCISVSLKSSSNSCAFEKNTKNNNEKPTTNTKTPSQNNDTM